MIPPSVCPKLSGRPSLLDVHYHGPARKKCFYTLLKTLRVPPSMWRLTNKFVTPIDVFSGLGEIHRFLVMSQCITHASPNSSSDFFYTSYWYSQKNNLLLHSCLSTYLPDYHNVHPIFVSKRTSWSFEYFVN